MKRIHILLAEDNLGDIILIREAFAERNLIDRISVVKDGKQALEFIYKDGKYANAETPDLIILDINLPKINGLEVLKKIKKSKDLKKIPVIMLTSSSSQKDINESYDNYANCFITKPDDVDDFLKAINGIEDFWINIGSLPAVEY
ncbi:response regulator [Arenibacter palladensis]|uniref:response regulator n=1 Tax=Arenibacter palladensis TaxID=237373 RepID=UPI002FD6B463